jgi:glycosyltransferase involved in cell wall biosynthesis
MTAGPGARPVELVVGRRADPAASYRIYSEKALRALEASGRPGVRLREVEIGAEGARGGVIRPTLHHYLDAFPRDGVLHHATEPNTAFRHVDVVTLHDIYPFDVAGTHFSIFRGVIRSAARRARRIVVQTSGIRDDVRRHLGDAIAERVRIVPAAFPAPPTGRLPPAYDVLWVGSLDERKRPDRFLEGLGRLTDRRLKVGFLCHFGASPIEPRVRAALAGAQRLHDVEWLRTKLSVEELDRLYRSSRVLVSTSTVEGFHFPVMEAWSRGTRIVVPEHPPYPETYGRSEGVRYYDPSEGFAAPLLASLGAGPFTPDADRLAAFSYEAIGRRLSAVYEELGG